MIGNNIANLNTVGYKTARATFQETLNQTIAPAQPPSGGMGGVNPSQIGLGTTIGAVKSIFTQGNLQETGSTTDLAILGNGFFVVNNGILLFKLIPSDKSLDRLFNSLDKANNSVKFLVLDKYKILSEK